jgi:hypothetical protein
MVLQRELKKYYSELANENIYSVVSEQENTFTIRCSLPNYKGYYNIVYELDEVLPFKLPRKGNIIETARVDIRNLWKNNGVLGFNLELKYMKM